MTKTWHYWGRWPNKRHLHSVLPHLPAAGDIIGVNMASSCVRRFTHKQPLPQKGSSVSFVCLSFPGYCTRSVRAGHMTVTRWITSRLEKQWKKKTHSERKQMHQMSRNQRDPVWTNPSFAKRTNEVSLNGCMKEGASSFINNRCRPGKQKLTTKCVCSIFRYCFKRENIAEAAFLSDIWLFLP